MFFLVTGASGVGKSTVRRMVAPLFADIVESVELATLGITPQWSLAWRHQMVEKVVQMAIEAQENGRHFLLCGDPVPAGELYASPSADKLKDIRVCLLDVSPEEQKARLVARGDDLVYLEHHIAFADWMRRHAVDHTYRPDVIMNDGWEEMCWGRWVDRGYCPWKSYIVDASDMPAPKVADAVAQWMRKELAAKV